jgi:hypothetical protein
MTLCAILGVWALVLRGKSCCEFPRFLAWEAEQVLGLGGVTVEQMSEKEETI